MRAADLQIRDSIVPDRQHVPTRVANFVRPGPAHRPDQFVVTNLRKARVDLEPARAGLLYPIRQDLTGLVRAASGGRVFPPEEAVRHTAPFGVLGKQGRERPGIALVKGFDRYAKPINHSSETMAVRRLCRLGRVQPSRSAKTCALTE
jgi:hypothetical protein